MEYEETIFPETNTTKEIVMNAFAALSNIARIKLPGFEYDIVDLEFDITKGIWIYVWDGYPGWSRSLWGTSQHLPS